MSTKAIESGVNRGGVFTGNTFRKWD